MTNLEILYQDDALVAVNKPCGMLVHRSQLAAHEEGPYALQVLRDIIGAHVYPIHRLDRPTSGVLLFALDGTFASLVQKQFDDKTVIKEYWTICRGVCPECGIIDAPLENEVTGKLQEAETHFQRLATLELPIANARYPTSRYSLVVVQPKTGRMHQIRKHFAKTRHYLIGDTKHGNLHQNRSFQAYTHTHSLMLHAKSLQLVHPLSGEALKFEAPLNPEFQKVVAELPWCWDNEGR